MRVSAKQLAATGSAGRQSKGPAAKSASNGRKRPNGSGPRAAEKAEASAMYDSEDSFENHVIDLRGDEYKTSNGRDENCQTLDDAQSSEQASMGNGNAHWESDLDIDAIHPTGNRLISNGTTIKCHLGSKPDGSSEKDINNDPLRPREHRFIPGQLVWAKFARFPWWPAQIIDAREAKEGTGGTPTSDTDLLVRFFGTYDYAWVDPFSNLSDFDVKLAERSRVRKKALQKGVDEALAFRNSGILPEKWEHGPKSLVQKRTQNGHSDGVVKARPEPKVSMGDNGKASEQPQERKTPRKRKPKVLFEEEDRVERKPQKMQRRLRVMRQLGLVAPAGSPFTSDYSGKLCSSV